MAMTFDKLLAATAMAAALIAAPSASFADNHAGGSGDNPPTIDSNGDGKPDAWDTNGDGRADAWDTDGDGKPDKVDGDGDGRPDA
jgi:hypothetical protein